MCAEDISTIERAYTTGEEMKSLLVTYLGAAFVMQEFQQIFGRSADEVRKRLDKVALSKYSEDTFERRLKLNDMSIYFSPDHYPPVLDPHSLLCGEINYPRALTIYDPSIGEPENEDLVLTHGVELVTSEEKLNEIVRRIGIPSLVLMCDGIFSYSKEYVISFADLASWEESLRIGLEIGLPFGFMTALNIYQYSLRKRNFVTDRRGFFGVLGKAVASGVAAALIENGVISALQSGQKKDLFGDIPQAIKDVFLVLDYEEHKLMRDMVMITVLNTCAALPLSGYEDAPNVGTFSVGGGHAKILEQSIKKPSVLKLDLSDLTSKQGEQILEIFFRYASTLTEIEMALLLKVVTELWASLFPPLTLRRNYHGEVLERVQRDASILNRSGMFSLSNLRSETSAIGAITDSPFISFCRVIDGLRERVLRGEFTQQSGLKESGLRFLNSVFDYLANKSLEMWSNTRYYPDLKAEVGCPLRGNLNDSRLEQLNVFNWWIQVNGGMMSNIVKIAS